MPKKTFIFSLLILLIGFGLLIFNFTKTEEVKARVDDNVWGYAWSENIGWISFNSINCDADGDGESDGVPSGCPTAGTIIANYGVNIDPATGIFSGYAWSENIGWISFNSTDLADCPSGPCEARVDLTNCPDNKCPVSGWARAYRPIAPEGQALGGWTGWIKLAGDIGVFPCGDSVTFTYKGEQVTYGTVESQGECWMDRNLGASRVATAYDDAAAYGDLFQWGRCDDGHQDRNSASYAGPVSTDACKGGNAWDGDFITINSPLDWLSTQNDNLWQGVSGTNNPCPSGWRIPTEAELNTERLSWSQQNYNGAFDSPLKLTAGGFRFYSDASIYLEGSVGYLWFSDAFNTRSRNMNFDNSSVSMIWNSRAYGFPVRCIRDTEVSNYGVLLDTETNEFEGWAWGGGGQSKESAVIGWIDFEGVTFASLNLSPYVEPNSAIISDERYCDIAPGVGQISFQWTYKDNDGDSQSHYSLQVATDLGFNNKVVDREIPQSVPPDGEGTSAVLIVPDPTTYSRCISGGDFEGRCVAYGDWYYWQVGVKAATGNQDWSVWETGSPPIRNNIQAYPWSDFDWAPAEPSVGEVVQLCATVATSTCDISKLSICYDAGSNPVSCAGRPSNSFEWTIPSNAQFATGTNSSSENPRIIFLSMAEENKVTLRVYEWEVEDFCEKEKDIGQTALPLPEYKEVPPIIWLRNFLAWLASIFARF